MFDNINATSFTFHDKTRNTSYFIYIVLLPKCEIGKGIIILETIYTTNNKKWNNISLFEL